jgi:cytochrome c
MPNSIVPIVLGLSLLNAAAQAQTASAERGAQDFRACAACHSLKPDQNMTGPSLAGIWNRTAGTLASFVRYSAALKASGVKWDAKTLDQWLGNPAKFIPGNHMTFQGIDDANVRADLIAFFRDASGERMPSAAAGGMSGMKGMSGPAMTNLKTVGAEKLVRTIRYCRDSYFVTTADGKTADFWEPNLRFKTDSSESGPNKDAPAILPAGMQGDRASVFFAAPEEISGFIRHQCE